MEQSIFNYNKIYSNNNNIMLEIINDLNQLINKIQDNTIIKILGNAINKMNYIINQNKKNFELIRNDISSLYDKLNKKIDELKINNNNAIINQELVFKDGIFKGQVINGLANGTGIWKGTKDPFIGDKYEGNYINGKKEGKGIYYFHNGNIYDGEHKDSKLEGKGIFYWNNGNRYEGDFRNNKREGKGVMYINNGDRMMGDYLNDKPIGKHVILTKSGEVITKSF